MPRRMRSRQHPAAVQLAIRHLGEIDIDLVDAAVLHHRGDAV